MIRWKRPHDLGSIVRLVRTQLIPISPWQYPGSGRLRAEIAERLRTGATLVAAKSRFGEPFAFLHLVAEEDNALFIDLLAVDTSQQHRHWGTELMRRAEEYGMQKGCVRAYLFVDEGNERAQRFYRRLGYGTTQYVKTLRCFRMEKPLAVAGGGWSLFGEG